MLFAQNDQVIVHCELFEGRMCLERLAAPHFPMYDNLSTDTLGPKSNNLTACCLDQLVVKDNCVVNNGLSELYKTEHEMVKGGGILSHCLQRTYCSSSILSDA